MGHSESASGAEAFRWTSGGGIVGLGDLIGGSFNSQAYGVSADGSVVVGDSGSGFGGEAFRWTSGGGMVGLGDLTGGLFLSRANGVSADGSVVVGHGYSAPGREAFRWTSGGGMVGLGDLTGAGFASHARGVSADGSVVVGRGYSASGREAFRWTSGGGMVPLGDLPGGIFFSDAYDVSADGSVVVGWGFSSGAEAFRWTSGGGMVGLGDLTGGSFFSEAHGVSADGSVVVGLGYPASGNEAFLWRSAMGMVSLKDFLTNDLGLDLTGWTLSRAESTSDSGRVIAGCGTNPSSNTEAWVASFESLSLQWTGAGSGSWDTLTNWQYGLRPGAAGQDDLLINPANGLTVTGPASTTTVSSLTIGAQTNGTATLNVQDTGTLTVTGTVTVEARGKLAGDGLLVAAGGINNAGQIDLGGASLQLAGGTLTNHGTVRGNGQIDNTLANAADGQVWGEAGKILTFAGSTNTNGGEINLNGGHVVFTQDLTNSADGFIGGRGVLDVEGGLDNYGAMAFGSGLAEVYGDVTNRSGGQIVTSGGATTVFYDDVDDEGGELRISYNCNAVIFGSYNGGSTGSGTLYAEGDLRPGDSPGIEDFGGDLVLGSGTTVEMELGGTTPGDGDGFHDQMNIWGTLSVPAGATLAIFPWPSSGSFEPAVGDEFEVMTWGEGRYGEFESVWVDPWFTDHLITFDVSYGSATGAGSLILTAKVVPSPSTLVGLITMGLMGALGYVWRRRRRGA